MGGFLEEPNALATEGFFGGPSAGGGGGMFGLFPATISSSCPGNWQGLPNLPGPIQPFGGVPCGCFNDFVSPFGVDAGNLTPQVPSINGNPLLVFALITGSPSGAWMTICLSGVLPQNAWASMTVSGSGGIWQPATYVSASADVFDNTTWAAFGNGITVWLFDTATDPFSPFLYFQPYTVTFT